MRIADRDHQLANLQRRRITQLSRMQVAPIDADHRQIAEGITSTTENRNSRPSGNDAHPPRVDAGTTCAFVTTGP